jgi:tape measure domain-containing protein
MRREQMADNKLQIIIEAVDNTRKAVNDVKGQFEDMGKSVNGLSASMGNLKQVFGGFISAVALYKVGALFKDILEAGIAMDRLVKGMSAATGSAQAAAGEMRWLREESDRLGLSFVGQAEGYKGLAAAARGTSLEGQGVREIYVAIAEAGAALQLSEEQVKGALLAVIQMMSKGTVNAEELRGQLGERLPGTFQIAARAMGVTTAELSKMLDQGKLLAEDFLPKFAQALHDSYGQAAVDASNSAIAAMNSYRNTLLDLENTVAEKLLPTYTRFLRLLAEGLKVQKSAAAIGGGMMLEAGIYLGPEFREGVDLNKRLDEDKSQEADRRWRYRKPTPVQMGPSEAELKKEEKAREKWLKEYLADLDIAWKAEVDRNQQIGEVAMVGEKWKLEAIEKEKEARKEQAKQEAEYFKMLEDVKEAQVMAGIEGIEEMKKQMSELAKWTERTANAMEQNFSDFFYNIGGGFKSFGDMAKGVLNSIRRGLADYLGMETTNWLFGTLGKGSSGAQERSGGVLSDLGGLATSAGNWISSMFFHEGGIVGQGGTRGLVPLSAFFNAPRYHAGLCPDEVPAILQKGETVLPKGSAGTINISVPISADVGSKAMISELRTEMEGTALRVIRKHM